MNQNNQLIDFTKWLLKRIAIFVSVVIAISCAISVCVLLYNYISYDRPKNKIEIKISAGTDLNSLGFSDDDKIALKAGNLKKVSDETLLKMIKLKGNICIGNNVEIINNSRKTIESISLHISANIIGHSNDISEFQNYDNDLIIKPGKIATACLNIKLKNEYLNTESHNINYKGSVRYVVFEK